MKKSCIFILLIVSQQIFAQKNQSLSIDDIRKKYFFIGDFTLQEEPKILKNKNLFWRYPFLPSRPLFPLDFSLPKEEIPMTKGDGLFYLHLNDGRKLFLEGQFEEARKVWLTARARFARDYPENRRMDYFIALSFLQQAKAIFTNTEADKKNSELRGLLANAATFLNWALIVKKDNLDTFLDTVTHKQLYNLAAIYYFADRYSAVYGISQKALGLIMDLGQPSSFETQFHRMLAEAYIKNRSYLEAVQELDLGIRRHKKNDVALIEMFNRVGDIYYALNNFPIATSVYEYAKQVGLTLNIIDREHIFLLTESLFWQEKFPQALKLLKYGLSEDYLKKELTPETESINDLARLRYADLLLATNQLEDAKLEYFRIMHEIRKPPVHDISEIRFYCLENLIGEGKNKIHAANFLKEKKTDINLSKEAKELAASCYTRDFVIDAKDNDKVAAIAELMKEYPQAFFAENFREPLRLAQRAKFQEMLKKGKNLDALSFFEKNRQKLFKDLSEQEKKLLFELYLQKQDYTKANEFWSEAKSTDWSKKSTKSLLSLVSYLESDVSKKTVTNKEKKTLFSMLAEKTYFDIPPPKLELTTLNLINSHSQNDKNFYGDELIFTLTKTLLSKSPASICTTVSDSIFYLKNKKIKDLKTFVQKNLEEHWATISKDEQCIEHYLSVEKDLYKTQPKTLLSIYQKRNENWEKNEVWADLNLDLAIQLRKSGNRSLSKDLLTNIIENGEENWSATKTAQQELNQEEESSFINP